MARPNIPISWILNQNAANNGPTIPSQLNLTPYNPITASENMARFSFIPYDQNPSANLAVMMLNVSNNVAAGQVLTINSGYFSVTLTSSYTPSFDEFWSEAATNNATYRAAVAQSIAYQLQNTNLVSSYYDVYSLGSQIYLVALDYGSLFDLTLTATPTGMTLGSNGPSQPRYTPQLYIDYSTFIEVYISDEEYRFGDTVNRINATLVDTLYLPFTGEEQSVNVNGLIKPYVETSLPVKGTVPQLNLSNLGNAMRGFYITYGDNFRYIQNGEKKNRLQGMSAVYWTLNAALDKLQPYDLMKYVFNGNAAFAFDFLTSQPNDKEITPNGHEYLSWIQKSTENFTQIGFFGLEVTYRFYDGTNLVSDMYSTSYAGLDSVQCVDVSPAMVNVPLVETTAGKQVSGYTVRIWWTTSFASTTKYYSQPQTYTFLRKCNEQSIKLLFLNEFGAWDSLEFRGEFMKSKDSRNNVVIQRALPFNANTSDAIDSEVKILHTFDADTTWTIESGFMSSNQYDWVQKMLESSAVYVYNSQYNKYQSVIIEENSFEWNSKDNEFNLTLEYSIDVNTIRR